MTVTTAIAETRYQWWHGATIYQIYPRSFLDADGDGIGDLPGITSRLEHVARLGVDGVWISPFFTSPMADYGYDVADYCDVDPRFGTLADFDALVARAHDLGLKVMIDLVFAHTSDQHPWFVESRAGLRGAKAADGWPRKDWYVWADPKPDGTPPSNWQSVFGGPAWSWDARRRQYYMHQFLKEQPQLNVHEPDVQEALLDVVRFWLDRGVDGFRFDALNHSMFDRGFRDNPPAPGDDELRTRPFDYQLKTYSQDHPDVVGFIERIRQVCEPYGTVFTIAEVGGDYPEPLMRAYTAGDTRLSSAYSFTFLYASDLTPARVAAALAQWPNGPETWPSWAFDNHDAPRSISRWRPAGASLDETDRFARMEIMLLAVLRGNIFIYQGQELGLEQDDIPFEMLRDPEAIANWPLTLGRDGVRTPIPWNDEPLGGFTTGVPWLPLSANNRRRAVAVQEHDPASLLNWTRQVLALRQASPALRLGSLDRCVADGNCLSFTRTHDGETLHCLFNLGSVPITLERSPGGVPILSVNSATPTELPAWGAIITREIR